MQAYQGNTYIGDVAHMEISGEPLIEPIDVSSSVNVSGTVTVDFEFIPDWFIHCMNNVEYGYYSKTKGKQPRWVYVTKKIRQRG